MVHHLTATGRQLPYGITQCYLPPDTSEFTGAAYALIRQWLLTLTSPIKSHGRKYHRITTLSLIRFCLQ